MDLIKFLFPIVFASSVLASSISSVYQQKCGICHGLEGEKIAFGKSEAIHGMPVEKIEQALYDYASATKKTMPMVKAMKKNFVDTNNKEQIHALAEYINTL